MVYVDNFNLAGGGGLHKLFQLGLDNTFQFVGMEVKRCSSL